MTHQRNTFDCGIEDEADEETPFEADPYTNPDGTIAEHVEMGTFIANGVYIDPTATILARSEVDDDAIIHALVRLDNTIVRGGANIGVYTTAGQGTTIGSDTRISESTTIGEYVGIGDDCVIGHHVRIFDEVIIGNNVHIGNHVVIAKGTEIPDNWVIRGYTTVNPADPYPHIH